MLFHLLTKTINVNTRHMDLSFFFSFFLGVHHSGGTGCRGCLANHILSLDCAMHHASLATSSNPNDSRERKVGQNKKNKKIQEK